MDDFQSFQGEETKSVPFDWEKEAKRIALRYNGRGEGEIMKEIFARAAQGKRDGTLSNEQIDEFYNKFVPALDEKRKKKLEKLISQLKEM